MASRESQNLELKKIFQAYFNKGKLWEHDENPVQILVNIVDCLRTPGTTTAFDLTGLIALLEENEVLRNNFIEFTNSLFAQNDFVDLITDTGMLRDESFFKEFTLRFYNLILPYQGKINSTKYILSQVFNHSDDYQSILLIPYGDLYQLFNLLEVPSIDTQFSEKSSLSQLIYALKILTLRLCGKAIESETLRMVPTYNNINSPFLAFHNELESIKKHITKNQQLADSKSLDYKQLHVLLKQCEEYIDLAYKNSNNLGISLSLNKNLARMRMQLMRIEELIPLIHGDTPQDGRKNTIDLYLKLIQYNAQRKNLKSFISETTQLFAYEITSQTAETGKKYISEHWYDYGKMFYKAAGGGVIVGILCIIKVLLSKLDVSDFGQAVLYSLNYSLGFIAIYLTGMSLATKQPAMTASTVASFLEADMRKEPHIKNKYNQFAAFFARLIRTQFVAFLGNILLAFLVALVGIFLLEKYMNIEIGKEKANLLIHDLNPIESLALLHAAIAGVYLFISGLISGNRSNSDKYYNLPQRIKNGIWTKKRFGLKRAEKISRFYEHYYPGLVSNFWFGVFMGTTASVGKFLGLNLDIRHITFSSGNFALGAFGKDFILSYYQIFWSLAGIILIGFINFAVSFNFSLFIAFKAKKIPGGELRNIISSIINYFLKKPLDFIFPPIRKQEDNSEPI
ncbi:Site-specific recombinase [Candidatus Ornithobacterium hominis]|uniref:recombinase n=1 Tax=Candidatus Ornithobacterium hominis TaxID=2497989 RepID=UPI000E5A706D|nr:recombinase [Candidatus Ornithobacterium hominis]SZD71690.1 Site-specific recombinase [Candidatus Ornithobacterium hominis]